MSNATTTRRPRKAIIRKWVEALRSGKYKRGSNWLRYEDGNGRDRFCCLGVLCDLHALAKHRQWSDFGAYDDSETQLPMSVQSRAGLPSSLPEVRGVKLSALNDSNRYSFKRIADMIEAEYLLPEKAKGVKS